VPASLGTESGSYRPGSTAGAYGVQSAGYQQPAAPPTSPYSTGGSINYGNTYTR
jgi:hypothetical protein